VFDELLYFFTRIQDKIEAKFRRDYDAADGARAGCTSLFATSIVPQQFTLCGFAIRRHLVGGT
jgi:hypothetical protein